MKKHLLAALGIGILGVTSYAATFMNVKTKDGESVKFDVDDVDEVIFVEDETPADTIPVSDHEYVDLGLPSGTLWATYNIGATKPEEFGDYFAWGETAPKEVYNWDTYKYAKASRAWNLDSLTKYNSGNYGYPGVIDSLTTLLVEDDAATANWGSEWRMPTTEEQQELIDNCQYEWTEVNGVSGAKFTGSNGNSIFLPAAGYRYGSDVFHVGDYGYYWSSSLCEEYGNVARYLFFDEDEAYWSNCSRSNGVPGRAVRAKKAERKTYSVKFYTSDSILIESQNVVEGMSAKEVKAPWKTGYSFVGWSTATDSVVSNMSVYALYKEIPYVDLGLPSGTLWATYNIGATKPEECGDYFAWGETVPKEVYDWSTYKYIIINKKGNLDSLTKYYSGNSVYPGVIDSLTTLLAEDDAATANWGSDWRMPTTEEQQELIKNCQYEWTEANGVKGAKFTASNGNSIFLPAAGLRYGSYYSYYWLSSLYEESESLASGLYFYEHEASCNYVNRDNGFPVRAVRAKK